MPTAVRTTTTGGLGRGVDECRGRVHRNYLLFNHPSLQYPPGGQNGHLGPWSRSARGLALQPAPRKR